MLGQAELFAATEDFTELSDCIELHKSLIHDWVFSQTGSSDSVTTEPQLLICGSTLESLKSEVAVLQSIIRKVKVENQAGVDRQVKTEEDTSQLDRAEEIKLVRLQLSIEATMNSLMAKETEIQRLEEQAAYFDGAAATLAFNHDLVTDKHEIKCLTSILRRSYRIAMLGRSKLQETAKQHSLAVRTRDRAKKQLYLRLKTDLLENSDTPVNLPEHEPLTDAFGIIQGADSSSDEESHIINLLPSIDQNEEVILHKDYASAYEVALLERIVLEEKRALREQLKELAFQHKVMMEASGRL
jgi:hypothetical protein